MYISNRTTFVESNATVIQNKLIQIDGNIKFYQRQNTVLHQTTTLNVFMNMKTYSAIYR